jgi:hypothetical protein
VAPGFFPLDEELALLPGSLSPWLAEALVRLSTHIPSFAKASRELAWFTGVTVHPDTARRRTEAAGAVLVAHETAEADRIVREHPAPPCTPDTLVFSVDGAMVPLRHGQWTEVRTLAVGDVQPPQATPDDPVIHTTNLSYFSRRTDSTRFSTLATGELHRRGIEGARRVGVVVDGAAWCQSFIDLHYPEAVRILDFAHAAEYLATIAQTPGADGPLLCAQDHADLRHALKHAGPDAVLPRLRTVVATHPDNRDLATALAYLEQRVAQMQYPQFQADGWPIGSGMVESANKLVVEDRLKGAGMHWAEANVNPLLALRNAVCNDRWAETWPQIEQQLRQQARTRQQARRNARQPAVTVTAPPQSVPGPPAPTPSPAPEPAPTEKPPHPWKRAWSIRRQRELAGAA